ncbi:MAG: STT3 domain-containing protein [Candidatus Bathyarchaeota archaeon]|jgi:dolichyl-diphosphooligosaccharide--protein glycosyltransferase
MKLKNLLIKDHFLDAIKSIKRLQPRVDHSSLLVIAALSLILFIAFSIRIFPLYWEIQIGTVHLSEFDPYFQFRFANHVVENGFISWAYPEPGWVDLQRWYPQGYRAAVISKKPALPLTAAFLYRTVTSLGMKIDLMDLCAIFPALTGALACLVIYFLGKDFGGRPVGLLASLFLALSPSYIQRTAVGFFDTETIGILALVSSIFLFLRSVEKDRALYSAIIYALSSGIALGYFCSGWGGSYYPIGIMVLFALTSILLKRYTQRLFLSYSLTFGLGLFIAVFMGPRLSYLVTAPILAVAGAFLILALSELLKSLESTRLKVISVVALLAILIAGFSILWHFGYMKGISGKFISVIDPLIRGGAPLVESVAEHRISAWGSIYYEFGVIIIFFISGFFFILRDLNDRNLFLLILGLTSLYFASSMVRLLVLMAPAFSLLAAIGITGILKPFFTLLKETPRTVIKRKYSLQRVGREFSGGAVLLIFLILMTHFAFPTPRVYSQAWSPVTITAGSLPIAPSEPVQEWYDMLNWANTNLEATTVVCSWWDYGYWLTVLGNVTSLADNATINKTQIQNIGFIFMANETQAIKMLKNYDAKYILVYTVLTWGEEQGQRYANWAGYGDEGKWMWMARISGAAKERFINDGYIDEENSWTEETTFGRYNQTTNRWDWNLRGMQSTVYRLMAWGKHRWCENHEVIDTETFYWRNNNLTAEDIKPTYLEEAYFSGINLSPDDTYGRLVPLICLYRINWQEYYKAHPMT